MVAVPTVLLNFLGWCFSPVLESKNFCEKMTLCVSIKILFIVYIPIVYNQWIFLAILILYHSSSFLRQAIYFLIYPIFFP